MLPAYQSCMTEVLCGRAEQSEAGEGLSTASADCCVEQRVEQRVEQSKAVRKGLAQPLQSVAASCQHNNHFSLMLCVLFTVGQSRVRHSGRAWHCLCRLLWRAASTTVMLH